MRATLTVEIDDDRAVKVQVAVDGSPKTRHRRLWQALAFLGCVAFGITMIINTQLACDGAWYWYADLLHHGQHLYSDLHVVFQPLPALEAGAWISLVGKGWMTSKILAVLTLIVFLSAISLLAAKNQWTDLEKALLIMSGFFIGIHFEAYRFDDYHVVSDISYLFAMALLLALSKDDGEKPARRVLIAGTLGLLAGITIENRITDGAGLLVCSFVALALLGKRMFTSLALFCAVAVVTVLCIVSLTGDSLRAYLASTVLHAAGPKGGATHVMVRPLLLLGNSLVYVADWSHVVVILLVFVTVASWTFLVQPSFRAGDRRLRRRAILGVVAICASVYLLIPSLTQGGIIVVLTAVFVPLFYVLALLVTFRLFRKLVAGNWRSNRIYKEVVIFLPFALLLAGALSSGGVHLGLYGPIAFLSLILPVIFPAAFRRRWLKSSFLVTIGLMAISGASAKVLDPASWQSYRSFPMFSHRLLIDHPVYGPMVIDNELHHFVERTCAIVKRRPNPDLLSIPLPYANYYCAIPPWNGFVQTFFDTAGKDVIDNLMSKLEASPPFWILYQRQLDMLVGHEVLYNGGKRLPQRDLDEFIVRKVRSGQWVVVDSAPYLGDEWVLMRTH